MAITTSKVEFSLDTQKAEHKTKPQFGMRYPDGSILWDYDEARDTTLATIYFRDLHEGKSDTKLTWDRLLEARAHRANIDVDTYVAQHQLVARDVNVFTTEPRAVVR